MTLGFIKSIIQIQIKSNIKVIVSQSSKQRFYSAIHLWTFFGNNCHEGGGNNGECHLCCFLYATIFYISTSVLNFSEASPQRCSYVKRCSEICNKFTGEHPCKSLISSVISVLLLIFRTPFYNNIQEGKFWTIGVRGYLKRIKHLKADSYFRKKASSQIRKLIGSQIYLLQ